MIQYLLDTDIASYFLKKYDMALVARVRTALRANQVAISAVTRAELRYGQALLPAEAARRYALIDAFIAEGRGRLAPPGSRATTQWLENTRIVSLSATYQAQHVVGGGATAHPLSPICQSWTGVHGLPTGTAPWPRTYGDEGSRSGAWTPRSPPMPWPRVWSWSRTIWMTSGGFRGCGWRTGSASGRFTTSAKHPDEG